MAPQLDYTAARSRKRGPVVLAVRCVTASALLLIAVWIMRPVPRLERLIAENRCATFDFTPSQIVLVVPPARDGVMPGVTARAATAKMYALVAPGLHQEGAIILLHERRSANRVRRVVVVEAVNGLPPFMLSVVTTTIERTFDTIKTPHCVRSVTDGLFAGQDGPIKILAPRIDAADESHFQIPYFGARGTGTIDGYLRDDGSVELAQRGP
jgi:hypothetical protein